MAFCPNCGAQLNDGAAFCPNCGAQIGAPANGTPGAAPAPAPVSQPNISIEILKRAFAVVMKKPFRLWGLSLLSVFLIFLSYILGGPVLLIGVGGALIIQLGMAWVYLDGYRGKDVSVDQIFEGFGDIKHSLAGMGWMQILLMLWALIPIAGYVLVIIKSYSYGLVPYIIRENKDMKATDVVKESKARTEGYKGKMFLTDLVIVLAVFVVFLVLGLLSAIPYIGGLFMFILVIVAICTFVLLPLYCGLVHAAWYEEICKRRGINVQ